MSVDKELLTHMHKHGITVSSDGLLRDMIVRGLWRQAVLACDESIARRERDISALRELRRMVEGKEGSKTEGVEP